MNADTLLENFEILAEAPGGIARLRSLVLSLAMSGQLVQRDSDWVEERLGECVVLRNGRAYSQTELLDTGTPVIRIQNLNGGKNWYYSNLDLLPEKLCEDGDLLFAWSASFGPYIWSGPTAIFHYHIWKIEVGPQLHKEFLFYLLQHLTEEIKKSSHGLAMLHMTKKKMENLVVSFPSVSEQLRVVDKVREIFLLCEELEAAQNQRNSIRSAARKSATDAISTATTPEELEAAWKRINNNWEVIADTPESIGTLRQLLLDLAVRGLLVSQSQNDQTAIEFLENFSKNLERLPEVRGDVPFQIPESWIWVTFSEISKNRDSERIPLSKLSRENRKGEFDYYGASGVIDSIDDYLFDKPLLLIGEDGANLVNRSTPIAFIATGKYWVNNHAHVIDSFDTDALKYLALAVNQMDLKPFLTGTAQPKLNQAKLNKLRIPLPPHAEQKRIVTKVDELMALCDQLEVRLKVRSEVAEKFARSVVSAA